MLRSLLWLLPLAAGCATTGTKPSHSTLGRRVSVTVFAGRGSDDTIRALQEKPYLELQVKRRDAVLGATGAAPGSGRDAARKALESAREDYKKLRFAEAVDALAKAEAELASSARDAEDFAMMQQLMVQRGLCLLALKREDEATKAFSTALNLGYAGPEAGQFPPEVEGHVRKVKDALAGAPPVGLTVKAQPRGAGVWVDGKDRGRSPVTVQLAPGLHHIRVTLPGHRARSFFHSLWAGKSDRLEVFLKPVPLADLKAQLAAREVLADLPPQLLARAIGPDVALVEVEGERAKLLWTGDKRLSPGACAPGPPKALADCLGPLLYRLQTGAAPEASSGAGARPPVYKRWWFWTLVGAGVAAGAGAGVGIYYGTRDRGGTNVDIVSVK
jgi:hypothetical protein